ncbi:MAG: LLM class flavin-dependent oxidoreductase [Rhodospirillaceae bacterium]|nr:LLM class flavin-dependent oxidoreductase [Rhodospirillaceae bacterium]
MALTLSVLDQSPIRSGGTAFDAIEETVKLAQATEKLGYHRYWLAEHHGTEGLAGCSPEVLIARVAAATKTMRVGSGGVMLSHYSPLKVAENFALLQTMYPGRIDLGLGRAPGGDYLTSVAMQYGSEIGVEYYPTKVVDLKAFLTGSEPANKALAKVKVTPRPAVPPEMWLLGSSDESAKLAAMFGLPYSFAHFINPIGAQNILANYSENFQPSDLLAQPKASMCVGVICAPTGAAADRLALSRGLWRVMLDKGALGPYPTPEEAEAYPYTEQERRTAEKSRRTAIIGDPPTVKAGLERMAEDHGVDEIMVVTICHDFTARLRSYELIAEAFGLAQRAAA